MKKVSHFIDGKTYTDNKSRKGPIFNPAIGEQIAEVELASKTTVEMAIESSKKAFLEFSIAISTVVLLANSTSAICSPIAGLKIGPFRDLLSV